jgi:hypothetical protein
MILVYTVRSLWQRSNAMYALWPPAELEQHGYKAEGLCHNNIMFDIRDVSGVDSTPLLVIREPRVS